MSALDDLTAAAQKNARSNTHNRKEHPMKQRFSKRTRLVSALFDAGYGVHLFALQRLCGEHRN